MPFNRNIHGPDSRLVHSNNAIEIAKIWCDKSWDISSEENIYADTPFFAAQALGVALHPLQDWVAHGDYGIYDEGGVYDTHNKWSPQKNLLFFDNNVTNYPDNPQLDALNGPNGRPAGLAMHSVIKYKLGFAGVRLYAEYKIGSERLKLTRKLSVELLREYKVWLNDNGSCVCKKFFNIN